MTNLRREEPVLGSSDLAQSTRLPVTDDGKLGPAGKAGLSTNIAPATDSLAWIWQQVNQQVEQSKDELKRERQRYQLLAQRKAQLDSQLLVLRQAVEEQREELEAERKARVEAERELASANAGWGHVQHELSKLENERSSRLKIERRLALLDSQSDKALELAGQLAKERGLRLKLEREKGMLLNELKSRQAMEERLRAARRSHEALQSQLQDVGQRAAKLDLSLQYVAHLEELLVEEKSGRVSADERAAKAETRAARLEGELKERSRPTRVRAVKPAARHWLARLLFD